jgi:hypothetical protein
MRAFIFYRIEMEKMNKTLQYFWSYLYDPVKGVRSKKFSSIPGRFSTGAILQSAKV